MIVNMCVVVIRRIIKGVKFVIALIYIAVLTIAVAIVIFIKEMMKNEPERRV